MMIQGRPASEVIIAIFIILWGITRFAGIALLVVSAIWLVMQSALLFFFLIAITVLSNAKVKW